MIWWADLFPVKLAGFVSFCVTLVLVLMTNLQDLLVMCYVRGSIVKSQRPDHWSWIVSAHWEWKPIVRVEMAHFHDLEARAFGAIKRVEWYCDRERSRTALQLATIPQDSELFAGTRGNSSSLSTSTDLLELHLDLCFVALLFGRLWQTHDKVWPGISVLATVVICHASSPV